MPAIDESASRLLREIRGTLSIASTVALRAAALSGNRGLRRPDESRPACRLRAAARPRRVGRGGAPLNTMSGVGPRTRGRDDLGHSTAFLRVVEICAGVAGAPPRPRRGIPCLVSFSTTSGTVATRTRSGKPRVGPRSAAIRVSPGGLCRGFRRRLDARATRRCARGCRPPSPRQRYHGISAADHIIDAIALPASTVVARETRRSRVRGAASGRRACARSRPTIAAAAAGGPGLVEHQRADQIIPIGLAMPWPAMSGAEAVDQLEQRQMVRSGIVRFADGAMPIVPQTADRGRTGCRQTGWSRRRRRTAGAGRNARQDVDVELVGAPVRIPG